jgi:tripartite ATP-independent transporter DctM subunit
MVKRGYSPDFAVGTVAAGGTLGIMIPPSVTFCIYAILTENSIVRLFMAGIIPGLMLAGLLVLSIIIRTRLNPALISYVKNDVAAERTGTDMTVTEAREVVKAAAASVGGRAAAEVAPADAVKAETPKNGPTIWTILPACALILVVLGSMYFGFATPFEAAGYGVIGAFVITLVQRRLTKAIFSEAFLNSARTGCMMMFLVICGMSMTFVVSYLGIPQEISATLVASGMNKYVILLLIYVLWFVFGALMEPTSMVLLTIPFLYTSLIQMDFDPLWIGVVLVVGSQIAMITPPVGLNLFVLKANTDIPMNQIIRGALPYVGVLLIGLVILTAFPGLVTFLPSHAF